MFGALAIGIGGLLLASKKVRKEIKRFGKKVKKTLKKVVKSKAFKIIAAAALIATGVYFVAGMLGTAGTAATVATNTAAANAAATTAASTSGIVARTATAIANGARTIGSTAYSAGSSTTAFLSKGFEAVKNLTTGGKESTGFDVGSFSSTPADVASVNTAPITSKTTEALGKKYSSDAILGNVPMPSPTDVKAVPTFSGTTRTAAEIAADQTKNVMTSADITAAATPKGSSLLQKASKVKKAYDETGKEQQQGTIAPPSYGTLQDDFEGTAVTSPETMRDFSIRFPLLDPNMFKSNFNPNSFYSYKNLVRQP